MRFLSYFLPIAPKNLVYMLQQVEYDSSKFADWVDTAPNLTKVQTRQTLDITMRVKITLLVAYILWGLPLVMGVLLFAYSKHSLWLLVSLLGPLFCVVGLYLFNSLFGVLVVTPSQSREISRAESKLKTIAAMRIAVLGSYGKTTMKELLTTILSEGKQVRATPGNKNALISHARWVSKEVEVADQILIFEYGEAAPGDITRLASFSQPDWAVITGVAPAHLEDYGTLGAIAKDFSDIGNFAQPNQVYINAESPELIKRLQIGSQYSLKGVNGWKVSDVKIDLSGTKFKISKGKTKLDLHTQLLGAHQIGPLCAAINIAHLVGLTNEQIKAGVAKTKPFKHRMQPYGLGGALIIDDTYNGNIEGVKAGLALLKALEASGKKVYVTPGLVEQGDLTEKVHEEMGRHIAKSGVDRVVLMKNSVTSFIESGLKAGDFSGELIIEPIPLDFYTNLEHFVAGGDIVLMQNDWPDSYK